METGIGYQIFCFNRTCRLDFCFHSKLPTYTVYADNTHTHIYISFIIDNDWDIPSSHASTLFNAFLTPYLPTSENNSLSHTDWNNYSLHENIYAPKRSDIVSTTLIEGYGVYEETNDDFIGMEGLERKVALLRIESGHHDIGRMEGVQDTVGRMFGLY